MCGLQTSERRSQDIQDPGTGDGRMNKPMTREEYDKRQLQIDNSYGNDQTNSHRLFDVTELNREAIESLLPSSSESECEHEFAFNQMNQSSSCHPLGYYVCIKCGIMANSISPSPETGEKVQFKIPEGYVISGKVVCPGCNGEGTDCDICNGIGRVCARCQGDGEINKANDNGDVYQVECPLCGEKKCPDCDGTGFRHIGDKPNCKLCNGTGKVHGRRGTHKSFDLVNCPDCQGGKKEEEDWKEMYEIISQKASDYKQKYEESQEGLQFFVKENRQNIYKIDRQKERIQQLEKELEDWKERWKEFEGLHNLKDIREEIEKRYPIDKYLSKGGE